MLSYLEVAGYTINGMNVSSAPKGAGMGYSIIVAGGKNNPLYPLVSKTAELFKDIGMTLDIVQAGDKKAVQKKKLQKGSYSYGLDAVIQVQDTACIKDMQEKTVCLELITRNL